MKRYCLLIFCVFCVGALWAARMLYLAPDSVYYYPYADGTASVSGAKKQGDSLIIATHIMIPDSCLSASAADPANMSKYRVTVIGEGAFEASAYKYVKLPDSLLRIDANAFLSCTKMTKCDLPSTVTEIGTLAFFSCNKLTSLDLPNIEKLGLQTFARCSSLQSISLGDKLDTLPKSSFTSCSSVSKVELGSGLKYIGQNAFARCSSLKQIVSKAVVPPTADVKAFQYLDVSTIDLQVPCDAASSYAVADIWRNMQQDVYSKYTFEVLPYDNLGTINVLQSPNDCNEYYADLEAVANIDYEFVRWSDGTTNPHYKFTQDRDTMLYAYFDAVKKDTISGSVSVCENRFPYYWADGEQYLEKEGTFTYNKLGGSYVYRLEVSMLEFNEQDDLDTTICGGKTVTWRGNEYSETGVYYDTLVNQYGCDSILAMYLTVTPTYTLDVKVECYLGNEMVSTEYGSVEVSRSGECNNRVSLKAQTDNRSYYFSHWRMGDGAVADNPLVLELDDNTVVRAVFYDNSRTPIDISTGSTDVMQVYDTRGILVYKGVGALPENMNKGVYIIKFGNQINKVVK